MNKDIRTKPSQDDPNPHDEMVSGSRYDVYIEEGSRGCPWKSKNDTYIGKTRKAAVKAALVSHPGRYCWKTS